VEEQEPQQQQQQQQQGAKEEGEEEEEERPKALDSFWVNKAASLIAGACVDACHPSPTRPSTSTPPAVAVRAANRDATRCRPGAELAE
jgi:hypothetical protein